MVSCVIKYIREEILKYEIVEVSFVMLLKEDSLECSKCLRYVKSTQLTLLLSLPCRYCNFIFPEQFLFLFYICGTVYDSIILSHIK